MTVEAGIHLRHDPIDPLSTEENSLLYQLHHAHGLNISDLGGITHQTVAGFLSTGSSGGSLQFGILETVHALQFVDGTSQVFTVTREDADQSNFKAALVSMGLFGVLSTVTLNCTEKFNIKGCQTSKLVTVTNVDIYDDNPVDGRKGLSTFLKETQYSQMLWWPQTSSGIVGLEHERLQVWQAEKIKPTPNFERKPFKDFANAEVMMLSSY